MAVTISEPASVVDHDDVLREHGYHTLAVKQVVQETHDTRSFVLDVPDDLRETFRYRAGQFCTFRVRIGDGDHMRCYSMSSAPETDPDLTVTVKRVPGGLVSNWFNDHVSQGDVLDVTKPAGVFCVREGERPVVAFCGGSGVTPVMSIAKSVLATTHRPVKLLCANRDRHSVIFDDELRYLHSCHSDRFDLRHHFDSDAGFLEAPAIAGFAEDSLGADFYICGPGPFMDLVEATLLDLGVDPSRILIERFVVAGQPAGAADGDAVDTDTQVTETVTVVLRGKTCTVAYQPGDTLLETARRGGLQPPFSCESGNCATCMAVLRDGSATMRVNNALTPDEVDAGWILTCQALPRGSSVTVEYEAI
jgi:3-ketosteroid 9alpha-monooxygenase subunit B